jgi:hypothetical protein
LLIDEHEDVGRVLPALADQTDLMVLQINLFENQSFFGCKLFIVLLLFELQRLLEEHISLLLETG